MLFHKVYANEGGCTGDDYTTYKSPFGQCYNIDAYGGREHWDLFDEILEWDVTGRPTEFRRIYYQSTDGSCQDQVEGVSLESSLWSSLCSSVGDSSEEESLVLT